MAVAELDLVEVRGDPLDPILGPGEEDVVGELARAQPDVILPFAGLDRDAGVRVRQELAPSMPRARSALAAPEDRGRFHERQAVSVCMTAPSTTRRGHRGPSRTGPTWAVREPAMASRRATIRARIRRSERRRRRTAATPPTSPTHPSAAIPAGTGPCPVPWPTAATAATAAPDRRLSPCPRSPALQGLQGRRGRRGGPPRTDPRRSPRPPPRARRRPRQRP